MSDARAAEGHPAWLAHHFDTPRQQFETGKLGIWIFLVTEILFFSGLFCAYGAFRATHPEVFVAAHEHLDKNLGALNTLVLIFSSLTMAWAVRCAQLEQRRGLIACLAITLACAAIFLGVKYVEYSHKWEHGLLWAGWFDAEAAAYAHPSAHGETPRDLGLFFSVYFAMTGLHALHVIGGIGVIAWILVRAVRGDFHRRYYGPVDYVALYWHLVDLVWIFLFPLLYLIA